MPVTNEATGAGIAWRTFWWRFGLYVFIGSVAVAAVGLMLARQRQTLTTAQLGKEETLRVALAERTLRRDLRVVVNDLRRTASSRVVREFIADANASTARRVRESFINLALHSRLYDQIRILDRDGRERVRVNDNDGAPASVPERALQDKAGRYYFAAANRLGPGQIYLSPLDLNVEHGAVETPFKPMIRAAIALFDAHGERRGVLVLNSLAASLLDDFRSVMADSPGEAMLLDADGHWLSHPDRTREWGFMFGRDDGFARAYPEVWPLMRAGGRGSAMSAAGLFVFATLDEPVVAGTAGSAGASDLGLRIVSRIAPEQVVFSPLRVMREQAGPSLGLGGVIAVVSALLAWLGAANARQARLLRRSEERYRQLFQFAPDGIVIADDTGRCLDINRAGRALLGHDAPTDLAGQSVAELIVAAARPRWRQSQAALRVGHTDVAEWDVIDRHGAVLPVEVSATILPDGRWQGFIRDIRKRREAERQTRLAAAVFENTQEGILITDAERRIVAVNRAYLRMSGYSAEEVLGSDPRVQQSGRHDPEFYQALWTELKQTGQWQGEIWNRRKDGEQYPLWENISAVYDSHGALTHYVAIMTDIQPLKVAEDRLRALAHQDALTGLANRHVFQLKLEQSVEHARRNRQRLALMFLDLDRFKLINDTLGHAASDQVLKAIGQRLRGQVRAEDIVARLGGDEFTILLEQVGGADTAGALARKLIDGVSKVVLVEQREIHTSTSIGIAIFPDDATNAGDLARAADAALYRAKARGRRTFEFYTPELTAQAEARMSVEDGLRKALSGQQFRLHYQPQIDLASGRICGVEALLRWQHPERGLLEPAAFLDVAEESQLISDIGEWVVRESCAQVRRWQAANAPPVRMGINIAGQQLMYDDTVEMLSRALADNALDPGEVMLQLEITESLLQAGERPQRALNALRAMGFSIAIDDFGTGYSSLSHLKQLPVDTLKVDRAFMHKVPADRDNVAIVGAIISMGHSLGLRVIAEGVENAGQLQFLRAQGCDEVQGFLFSAAAPPEAIEAMLRADGAADIEPEYMI